MTQAIAQPTLTFEAYLLLPYDGRRTEFVNGAIVEVTEPSPLHIELVKVLAKALDKHLDALDTDLLCFSGPGIQIPQTDAPDNARDPDLIVCTAEQWNRVKRQTKALFLKGNAPLLAIKVVSPGSLKRDTEDLVVEYAAAGVQEYWVVNPILEVVTVYVLQEKGYALGGEYKGEELVRSELLRQWAPSATEMLG